MKIKPTYLALGEKATIFTDSSMKLKVVKGQPGVIYGKASKKVANALRAGHLVEVNEEEYQAQTEAMQLAVAESIALAGKQGSKLSNKSMATLRQAEEEAEDEDEEEEEDDDASGAGDEGYSEAQLNAMTKDEIVKLLVDEYDVEKDDIKGLNKKELVDRVLEEQSEA
jgi:hypothetical protein